MALIPIAVLIPIVGTLMLMLGFLLSPFVRVWLNSFEILEDGTSWCVGECR